MNKIMEKARALANAVGDLPPMPEVIVKSLELLNDPSSNVRKIHDKIGLDPALTAYILKVANSAFYGMRAEVNTITQAVNLMGYNVTRSILLSFLSRHMYYARGSRMVQSALWKHSLAAGVFARRIAEKLKRVNGEEGFVAALLHDIGKGVLFQNRTEEFERAVSLVMNQERNALLDAEYEIFGYSHLEIGYLLMKKWGFAEELVEALINHHAAQEYAGKNLLVFAVSLANKLCHRHQLALGQESQELLEVQLLGLSAADVAEIEEKSLAELEALWAMLN